MTSARLPYYPADAVVPPVYGSTNPLLGTAEFNTGAILFGPEDTTIIGSVFANQAGTLFIEQSYDASNWDVSTSYAISASDGKGFTEIIVADYGRVRYVNGATLQTVFRLQVSIRT